MTDQATQPSSATSESTKFDYSLTGRQLFRKPPSTIWRPARCLGMEISEDAEPGATDFPTFFAREIQCDFNDSARTTSTVGAQLSVTVQTKAVIDSDRDLQDDAPETKIDTLPKEITDLSIIDYFKDSTTGILDDLVIDKDGFCLPTVVKHTHVEQNGSLYPAEYRVTVLPLAVMTKISLDPNTPNAPFLTRQGDPTLKQSILGQE